MSDEPKIECTVHRIGPLPNFVNLDFGHGITAKVSVGALTAEGIEQFTERWSADFKEHCASKRKDNYGPENVPYE